jgi:hypothetical protein
MCQEWQKSAILQLHNRRDEPHKDHQKPPPASDAEVAPQMPLDLLDPPQPTGITFLRAPATHAGLGCRGRNEVEI